MCLRQSVNLRPLDDTSRTVQPECYPEVFPGEHVRIVVLIQFELGESVDPPEHRGVDLLGSFIPNPFQPIEHCLQLGIDLLVAREVYLVEAEPMASADAFNDSRWARRGSGLVPRG